jgi:hypothetical protein
MLDNGEKNLELPETKQEEDIIDINIDSVKKQKFRINGEDILELDTGDVNIITRLKEVYPKLNKLAAQATSKVDLTDDMPIEEQLDKMADALKEIDEQMRKYVDYIFDSNVSEVCAKNSSMYTPYAGKFKFEHITETLGALYANRIDTEAKLLSKRLRSHTEKYTGKRK